MNPTDFAWASLLVGLLSLLIATEAPAPALKEFTVSYLFKAPNGRMTRAKTVCRGASPRDALNRFTWENPQVISCHIV